MDGGSGNRRGREGTLRAQPHSPGYKGALAVCGLGEGLGEQGLPSTRSKVAGPWRRTPPGAGFTLRRVLLRHPRAGAGGFPRSQAGVAAAYGSGIRPALGSPAAPVSLGRGWWGGRGCTARGRRDLVGKPWLLLHATLSMDPSGLGGGAQGSEPAPSSRCPPPRRRVPGAPGARRVPSPWRPGPSWARPGVHQRCARAPVSHSRVLRAPQQLPETGRAPRR